MGRATTCSMILLSALCAPAFAGDDDAPVPAGTRFSTKVRYANAWSEETLSPDVLAALAAGKGQSSQELVQDAKKAATETAVADAHDPLHVDMTIEGSASKGGRLALKLLVSETKYWDAKGRSWTLDPSKRAEAESTVKEVAETWQKARSDPPQDAASRLEREMLEEQLLGAAVVLLDKTDLEVVLKARGDDVDPAPIEKAIAKKLPRTFPAPVLSNVAKFLGDAIGRLFVAAPSSVSVEDELVSHGAACSVTEIGGTKARPTAKLEVIPRVKDGAKTTGGATFEVKTGLVLEGKAQLRCQTLKGTTLRSSRTSWELEGGEQHERTGSRDAAGK